MKLKSILYFEEGLIKNFHPRDISKKNIFSYLSFNLGVISYKNLVFIKKNYPKTVKKHLKLVIKEEIESLFPEDNYSFFYQIVNETDTQIEICIWTYESKIREELITAGCSYIIPEPLIFSFEEPTVLIYQTFDFHVFVYSVKGKILNFLASKGLSKENLTLFLRGIGEFNSIRWIAYTQENIKDFFDENIHVEQRTLSDYPLFLDFIREQGLRDFRVKRFNLEKIEPYFFIRILIYMILALSLSLYISNKTYDEKINEIERKLNQLRSGIGGSSEMLIINKINEVRQKKQNISYIINSLSNLLPHGSFIRRISISEDSMDIFISTNEPLIVLNNFNFEHCFTSVKLASPINKEDGKFNMELKIGLDKCRFQEKS